MRAELIRLYEEMSDLTKKKCQEGCKLAQFDHCRHRCCDPMYCDMSFGIAKDFWDIEPEMTDHEELSFMGPDGNCILEPHLRPFCTLHQCHIESLGFCIDDPDWTREYFELRGKIDELQSKVFEGKF